MLRGGLIPCMVLVFYITSLSYFMWINFKRPNLCRVSGMNDVLSIQFAEYVRMYNKSYGAEEYYERQTYFEVCKITNNYTKKKYSYIGAVRVTKDIAVVF